MKIENRFGITHNVFKELLLKNDIYTDDKTQIIMIKSDLNTGTGIPTEEVGHKLSKTSHSAPESSLYDK